MSVLNTKVQMIVFYLYLHVDLRCVVLSLNGSFLHIYFLPAKSVISLYLNVMRVHLLVNRKRCTAGTVLALESN